MATPTPEEMIAKLDVLIEDQQFILAGLRLQRRQYEVQIIVRNRPKK